MADSRIDTVANVLRDHGHNSTSTGLTTDDLAKAIVDALDASLAGVGSDDPGTAADSQGDTAAVPAGNPETPAGTGIEGGGAGAAV